MRAQANVDLQVAEALLDNTAIPFIEAGAGNTHAHVELRSEALGGRMFAALHWSSGQGRLSSTGVRWFITDEEGDLVILDRNWFVRDISGSDTAILLKSLFHGSEAPGESYELYMNGGLLWQTIHSHGAEVFNVMTLFTATQTSGSQVPGGSSDPQWFDNAYYESQWGRGQYWPSGHTAALGLATEGYGIVNWAPGDTYTYDAHCTLP